MTQKSADTIKQAVKEQYGKLARRADAGASDSCCGINPSQDVYEASKIYSQSELESLPETVTAASAGCGNPTAISELRTGQTVLDLGSGGGIDCFLARQKVGPQGQVIGLDMTQDMIKLAQKNAETLGYANVEFRQGEMEDMPIEDSSVDVIISNCVINLSPDKDAVFKEAFRVLKPGGRLSVSDIVLTGPLPQGVRESLEQWVGCISGALIKENYIQKIEAAGFPTVEVVEEKDYSAQVEGGDKILSITLKALKP